MNNVKEILVHVTWLENQESFYMYAMNEDNYIPSYKWVKELFLWHKESYYGTFLEEAGLKDGLYLTPWQCLTFFAGTHSSSYLSVTYRDEAAWLDEHSPQIMEALQNGNFQPSFTSWQKRRISWDIAVEEAAEKPWISSVIEEWVNRDPELKEKWDRVRHQPTWLDHSSSLQVLHKDDWLQKIGWQEDTTPFSFGLRLTEPSEEEDDDKWKLEAYLRDKTDKSFEVELPSPDDLQILPKDWQEDAFLNRIQQEVKTWIQVDPSLEANDGNAIKQELTEWEAWNFLSSTSLHLAQLGVQVQLPAWWKEISENKPVVKMTVDPGFGKGQSFVGMNSIVDFNWKLATNDMELSEDEFNQLVEEKRTFIRKNGRWMTLDPAFVKKIQTMMQKVQKDGLQLRDILEQQMSDEQAIDGLDELNLRQIEVELNEQLKEMLYKLNHVTAIPEITISKDLHADLRPYQKKGVEWLLFLRQFGLGACLADDMGLGKTIQVITYLLHVKEKENSDTPALIICPTSVLGNWQKELERFAPSLTVHVHYGGTREREEDFLSSINGADVVLTTYTVATMDQQELFSLQWNAVALDEAQNIKNAQTKQSKAIRNLHGHQKIALTGTPIENRLTELWAIFDYINPGYLGSLTTFHKRFVQPIEKESNPKKIQEIQRLVRPFLLRRTKKDKEVNLNLPDKQEQKEFIPLTVEQASLYEQVVQDTFSQLETLSGFKRRGLILSMLTKLKQICNHPVLYLHEDEDDRNSANLIERSHKLEKLMELIENIREQDESCLIFTQYIGMGKMLQQLLQEQTNEETLFLHGSLSKEQRDTMVDAFQNKEAHILLLSLRAGGTGLNLTAANHVIHYDRWWNPAVENQATDRAYRIGQKRFVHVHKLITTGTLEEKIDQMIDRKKSLSDEIMSGENWITELSTDELRELFTLK